MDDRTRTTASNFHLTSIDMVCNYGKTVYANGRQQMPIRLDLAAVLNDVDHTPLSASEIASIYFFEVGNKQDRIPFSDENKPALKGWKVQRREHEPPFSYYPDASSAPETPKGPGQSLDFFLTADTEAAGRGMDVAFSFTGDNGWESESTGFETEAGQAPVYRAYLASPLRVQAVRTPQRAAGNYDLGAIELPATGMAPVVAFYNRLHPLLINENGRAINIREMACVPPGMIHWQTQSSDDLNPVFTGCVPPGAKTVSWLTPLPKGNLDLPVFRESDVSSSRGAFVVCGRQGIRRGENNNVSREAVRATYIDEYGSSHSVSLSFAEGTRDEAVITAHQNSSAGVSDPLPDTGKE